MGGIIIAGSSGLTRTPSEHYAGHFHGASAELLQLTADFIDGSRAEPSGDINIMPITESGKHARVALLDVALFQSRCFVVDLWARDGTGLPDDDWDVRGVPQLLSDLRQGTGWQVYNCHLALLTWTREKLYDGEFPA